MNGNLTAEAMIPLIAEKIHDAHLGDDLGFNHCGDDGFAAAEDLLRATLHLPAEHPGAAVVLLCGAKGGLNDLRDVLLAMPVDARVASAREILFRVSSGVDEALRILVDRRTAPLAPDIATIVNALGVPIDEARNDVLPSSPAKTRRGSRSPATVAPA